MTTTTNTPDTPIWLECLKCSGTGSVSWGINVTGAVGNRLVPKVCFDCDGVGGKWTTQRKLDRNARARERRAAKKEAQRLERNRQAEADRAEHDAELEAQKAAYAKDNPDVVAALDVLTGEFGDSLRSTFNDRGILTEGQKNAALRIAKEIADSPAPSPVVEGRVEITGMVKTTKWVDNAYGGSQKMMVLDDRGFRVWGTVPRSLEISRGDRVTFTATVTASQDDETFGFFSRPAKASMMV